MTASQAGDFESLARSTGPHGARRCADGRAGRGRPAPDWKHAVDWWNRSRTAGARRNRTTRSNAFQPPGPRLVPGRCSRSRRAVQGRTRARRTSPQWKPRSARPAKPVPEMFRAMRGPGTRGLEQWVEDASPWLDAWRREAGTARRAGVRARREHQERLQKLAQAQLDLAERGRVQRADAEVAAARHEMFEGKLAEREEPGRQAQGARSVVRPVDRCGGEKLRRHRAVAGIPRGSTARW